MPINNRTANCIQCHRPFRCGAQWYFAEQRHQRKCTHRVCHGGRRQQPFTSNGHHYECLRCFFSTNSFDHFAKHSRNHKIESHYEDTRQYYSSSYYSKTLKYIFRHQIARYHQKRNCNKQQVTTDTNSFILPFLYTK